MADVKIYSEDNGTLKSIQITPRAIIAQLPKQASVEYGELLRFDFAGTSLLGAVVTVQTKGHGPDKALWVNATRIKQ